MTAICGGALLAAVLGLIYTMLRIRRIERDLIYTMLRIRRIDRDLREALAEVDKFLND